MEAVSADKFWAWAAGVGIGFDPRYPGSDFLTMLPPRESSRFWMAPDDPYSIPHFVGTILDGLDKWETAYLWPHIGRFTTAGGANLPNEVVRDVIWRGAGLPEEWVGAVRVARDEQPVIVAALFASLALGGDSCSDLFFMPHHGRQIALAGHDDEMRVECTDETRMLDFVQYMEKEGYALPTEPPGAFKWQAWMRPGPASKGTWAVHRQDDNGNRFLMQTGMTRDEAERMVVEFEARGHKQFCWAEPE